MTEFQRLELTVFVKTINENPATPEANARFANHLVVEALELPQIKLVQVNNQIAVEMEDETLHELFARRAIDGNH